MTDISKPLNPSLGVKVQAFPRNQQNKINEIIDKINDISADSNRAGLETYTTAERDLLPLTVRLIYVSDDPAGKLQFCDGSTWIPISLNN